VTSRSSFCPRTRWREEAIAAGCDEFDTTPIESDRLVATVRRVLAHRK
jgi:hypothetical protein